MEPIEGLVVRYIDDVPFYDFPPDKEEEKERGIFDFLMKPNTERRYK